MKEKAADTEDHHTKVELDHQPKSLNSQTNINKKPSSITAITTTTTISTSSSSSSSSSSFISPNSIVPLSSSSSASKVSIPAKNSKPSSPSSSSIPGSPSSSSSNKTPLLSPSSNNNNNFDDDYNEWDISIGDLIIDLDADIEREGDKQQNNRNAVAVVENTKINNNNNDSSNNNTNNTNNNNNNKNNHNRKDNNNNNTRNDSTATINTASLNSTQQANSIIKNNINNNNKINSKKTETSATSLSGMSSNFKLNRLGPLASSGTSNSEKSATVSNNISNNNTNNNNNSNNSSSNNNPHGSTSAVLSLKPNSPGASTTIAAAIASTSAPISSSAASNSNNINNSGLSSTNGSTTSSNNTLNRHSHGGVGGGGGGSNNKSNFALSSSSTTGLNVSSSAGNISNASPSTVTTTSKNLNPTLIENHHAKGLKMKIKRKNIGGKTSEINHEIVSSDASPQNCRNSYISSIDQNNSGSTNLNLTNTNPATNSAKNIPAHIASNSKAAAAATTTAVLVIDSADTVINSVADPEEVVIKSINQDSGSFGSTAVATSKSIAAAKHSNKNKNGHRDKKDKTRIDKVKILPSATIGTFPSTNHPVQTATVSENDEIVSSSSVAAAAAAAGAANVNAPMIKYPNSTVINLKPEDAANNSSNNPNPVNSFKQRNKPEKLDDHISDQIDVGTMTSIATITEPDCLGPCEPGTSVTLEGIVWQETENGVLVVNVTWRGKTYVGTLLDCTKHDWAPPRFCESPTSDIESKSLKNTRGKRSRNNFITENSIDTRSVTSKLRNGKGRRTANSGYLPTSPAKGDSVVNLNANNKRKGRPNELELNVTEDNAKRTKLSKIDVCSDNATSGNHNNNNNGGVVVIGGGNGGGSGCVVGGGGAGGGGSNVGVSQQPNSPVLIECPEPNCSKKYRHINGLKYHQSHAHFGSTFNVLSDSQEFENTSTNETLNSNKGDVSDSDNNDSNALDSPLKIVDKLTNLDMIVKATTTQTKSTTQTSLSSSTTSLSLAVDESSGSNENEQQQNTPVAIDSVKKFLKNGCEPLDSNELGSDENYKPSFLSSSSSSSTHVKASFEDKNLISSDSELTGGDANLDLIAKSDLKHATENNSASERKTNSNDVVNHQTENLKIPGGDCEIDNVPSPAYSDISDDNSTNNDNSHASGGSNSNSGGSNNTMANTSSTAATAINMNSNKMNESFLESMKKMPNMNDFTLSALPHYLNKSSFLFPNHHHPTNDPKVNDLKLSESSSSLTDEMMENLEHQHQQQSRPPPQGPYPSYPLFRYGSSSSSSSASDFKPSAPPPLPPTSMIRMNESIDSNRNENDSKDNVSRNKDDNNGDYGSGSSSSSGGGGALNPKQPIVELQNLKNRISYSFDQNPGMYEMPKLKFPQQPPHQPQHSLPPPSMIMGENEREREREREREKPLKDRSKYSPQMKKSSKDKEHNNDNKEKNKHHHHQQQQQSHDEGMKPTMESTGPPTLSNGYYYNPSFLPPSFSFDSIFRGNALMGSPYGPPPQGPPPSASSFLHSQMRFPHMNMNLDGLAMSNAPNVSRTSTATSQPQQHSSINTSKNLGHSSSSSSLSYNHNNSKLLSPTSSSVCVPSSSASSLSSSHSALPPNFKSPSKEYPNHSMPMPQDHHLHHAQQQHLHPQHQQHRPSMNASNSTMHPPPPPPPRHSLHTSAIGYPIFDPYSAMIVNHAVQANSVHPFAPK